MINSKIVIVTWSYWSGKTTALKKLATINSESHIQVLIFDFVKRVEDALNFPCKVDILPLWCASCDDTVSYAQEIQKRIQDGTSLFLVEIPADKINIGWIINVLKDKWYADIDMVWVSRDGQLYNSFEDMNMKRTWSLVNALQDDLSVVFWSGYCDVWEDMMQNKCITDRNHIAWWLCKPLLTQQDIIDFFNIYKDNITRLKWQFYDYQEKKWYDIEYANWDVAPSFVWKSLCYSYNDHVISIMSADRETRSLFNQTFFERNENGDYIKMTNITQEEAILYDILLWNISLDDVVWSVSNFTNHSLQYNLLFNEENRKYIEIVWLTDWIRDEYIVAMMNYFTDIGISWDMNQPIVVEDFKRLSLPLYYLSERNHNIYLTDDIKMSFLHWVWIQKLSTLLDKLEQFALNNPDICHENAPFEFRPSTIQLYKSLLCFQ
jgi:hypothetical protein